MFMPAKFFHSFNFFPFFSQRFHPKTWACFRNFFFFESITLKITLIFFYFLFWVLCFLLKKKKRKEEKKKKREKIQFMLAKSLTENTIEPVSEENVFYNQVSATKRVLSNFVRVNFRNFTCFRQFCENYFRVTTWLKKAPKKWNSRYVRQIKAFKNRITLNFYFSKKRCGLPAVKR